METHDSAHFYFAPIRSRKLTFAIAVIFAAAPAGMAQLDNEPIVEGYITALSSANEFSVNGQHALTTDGTSYGIRNGSKVTNEADLRKKIHVGAYVYVVGEVEHQTVKAQTILFRDDLDEKLAGLGVIQRVITRGPETVVEADGYRIRITPATHTEFADQSLTLANVDVNTWVRYQGQRNQAGELVASAAEFLPGELAQQRSVFKIEENLVPFRPAGSTRKNPAELAQGGEQVWGGEVKLGFHWYRIPSDAAFATTSGTCRNEPCSRVPERDADDPSLEDSFSLLCHRRRKDSQRGGHDIWADPCVETDGGRLKSDHQVAAVLADGVAYNLQRQAARLAVDNRVMGGVNVAGYVASILFPFADLTGVGTP
jgi:hypothetical protein